MPVFTIRTQAAESDDILTQYPYWIWYPEQKTLTVSKSTYLYNRVNDSNGIPFRAPGSDVEIETTTFYYFYLEPVVSDVTVVLRYYSDLGIWQAELPWKLDEDSDDWVEIACGYQASSSTSLQVPIYTNGHTPAYKGSNGFVFNDSLPSDMPEVTIGLGDIDKTINDALNATTSTTTQANTIQSTVNSNLDAYENGDITSSEMQSVIDTAISELDTLASQSGNTLADEIAINNAQNATQIAQDKVISENLIYRINSLFGLSSNFISITDFNAIMQQYIYYYYNGLFTKEQVIFLGIGEGEDRLPPLQEVYSSVESALAEANTLADLQLMQSLIDITSQTMNNINNAGDVDKAISEAAESSDAAEKEYLDLLTAETTASIQDISPKDSFTDIEMGTAQEVLSIIWENKLVKRLLVICGCFMVVCVVLGIRYKV